jgi:hypothetical protein
MDTVPSVRRRLLSAKMKAFKERLGTNVQMAAVQSLTASENQFAASKILGID